MIWVQKYEKRFKQTPILARNVYLCGQIRKNNKDKKESK